MQKSFIAIALALTLTSAFAAYTATNYVTAPVSVAADSDTNYTNQTALGLASITSGTVYLYSGTVTVNVNNASANNWNLFYRQLNTKSLSATSNNTATPAAPINVFFANSYVIGFGTDNSTGAVNLYVYQTPLASGATNPGRIQLSNNTNVNWTVTSLGFAQIGNIVYVAYSAANLTGNITSFTVGSAAPGTPFTLSTTFDTPSSLALTWGEALGSSQLFAVWIEAGVLKDAVVDVSKKTVGTVTAISAYNSTLYPVYVPFVTDKKLYGEIFIGLNLTAGIISYYVRTTANTTIVPIATNYFLNTSTFAGFVPYGPYIAVFYSSIGATNGTNYAYEIWDLTAYNATSVQPRKLYLTIDSNSSQVPFRVTSGGYYTLLYNNRQQLNGTLTNVQVGLLLGSSYLASVLGFLLTIVAGLFLF